MLKNSQHQKLFSRLTPQQIRIMKLLEVTSVDLEQRVKEELEENPALELASDSQSDDIYQLDKQEEEPEQYADEHIDLTESEGENIDIDKFLRMEDDSDGDSGYKHSEESGSKNLMYEASFHDYLLDQLRMMALDERQQTIAEHIIGSIDDEGFLRREVPALVDDLAFTYNIATNADEVIGLISMIREFDPPGIAAWSLEESLLIQLDKLTPVTRAIRHAKKIVKDHFPDLINKYYQRIQRSMEISEDDFRRALQVISRLTPRPGASFGAADTHETYVVPDFYVYNNNGKLVVSLNALNAPGLKISDGYMEMLQAYNRSDKKNRDQREAVSFIKSKLDGARWFIDAIRQRQHTMMQTMQAIVNMQQAFFLTGDESTLKPMVLKNIAAATGLDMSTISRVTNSKFVQTEYGTYRLKFFFSESMQNESGEEISSREIKVLLGDLINNEDKHEPLTDDQLRNIMESRGYTIARRTIAKYREMLDIPVARIRRAI